MPLRCLFVDMNAFFAAVEQQENPALRHRPVAVVPTMAETTSCIAASYEAKALGIKTGTPVWEARKLGRGQVVFKVADHQRYVLAHNRIVEAVGSILPVERIASIDEMNCRLLEPEQRPDRAIDLARRIKAAIKERAGDYLTCSIGIGPNGMLAKLASDMQKPDGLTVLADSCMPQALYRLRLQDFPGIGPRMLRRFNLHGVFAVRQLCELHEKAMCEVWGSRVVGGRWYRLLRGEYLIDAPTRRQTVSHSHILPPALRNEAGAYGVLMRLTHKATARLRQIKYWAGAVSVDVSFQDSSPEDIPVQTASPAGPPTMPDGYDAGLDLELENRERSRPRVRRVHRRWDAACRLPHCQDTPNILRAVAGLWRRRAPGAPFKVGMVLSDLRPARSATPSLFDDDRRAAEVSRAIDDVNREFGASVVHFGSMFGMKDTAPTRVAFTQIPDFDRRVN